MRPARCVFTAIALIAPFGATAQGVACASGDAEVTRLTFDGNRAFSSSTLADGIVTTPSSWARRRLRVFGTRRCLDRQQFTLDAVRLLVWYRNHGYTAVQVDTLVERSGSDRVAITFRIRDNWGRLPDSCRRQHHAAH